jgi:hypothetical protein
MITELKPNQVFVFGSNSAGKHVGGAAAFAKKHFGAQEGCGEGLTGQSYAFPTLFEPGSRQRTKDMLWKSKDIFFAFALHNADKEFLMTAVGTGIAGFSTRTMKALFANPPANIVLPPEWKSNKKTK